MASDFRVFSEIWLRQLETSLEDLLSVTRGPSRDHEHRALVARLMDHYKTFYATKSDAARTDVLALFCPSWLSSEEKPHLWITGWKPSLAFRLVDSLRQTGYPSMHLSEEQMQRIGEVRERTSSEEKELEREMEKQQAAVAGRKMVELARLASRVKEGEEIEGFDTRVQVALQEHLAGLERIVISADSLRMETLNRVVEVLSPIQAVDFMAAVVMLHIQGRRRHGDETRWPLALCVK
ncbi:protein DOG1-like 4 [Aristolochia californica]|uniref:protein DOG1-like 4 n=1 Tax=Aristolochia californica TaxID=171875 RepID=UPI0035D5A009